MDEWRFEMYHYKLILPGREACEPAMAHREKTLGQVQEGNSLRFPDVADGVLTLPEVEWEIVRVEESSESDGRLILRRPPG